jgi:phospholipase/carboxylesterase
MSGHADLGLVHVYEPAAADGAPTLVLLHGTGGDQHDLLPLVPHLLPNAGVLSVRGAVIEHGMPRFFRRLSPGVFDMEDLAHRTDELRRFIDEAAMHYGFARDNAFAVGLSNGANIAANLLLTHGAVLRGAILFRAMPTGTSPVANAARGIGIYMSSGRRDQMISVEMTESLAQQLRDAGANVTLQWDDGGHQLTRTAIDGARAWLETATGEKAPPFR